MREAELLIALAHDGGIQMNLTDKVCTIETKYPGFTVKGVGPNIHAACVDTAHWIFDVLKDHPKDKAKIPNVLLALEAYDTHTAMMRI